MSTTKTTRSVAESFEHRMWTATAAVTGELRGEPITRRALLARLSRRLSEDGGPPITPEQFETIARHVEQLATRSQKEAERDKDSFADTVERAVVSVLQIRNNKPATTGALHELTGFRVNVRYFGQLLHGLERDGKLLRESGVARSGRPFHLWSLPADAGHGNDA